MAKGIPRLGAFFSERAIATGGGEALKLASWDGGMLFDAAEITIQPAIKGWGGNAFAQSIKQGLNFADDAGQGFSSFNKYKRVYGKAGEGRAWHHIVEKHADNIGQFGAESIHNTNNLIKLQHGAGNIHNKISGYYSSKDIFTNGQTVRQWLKGQSYENQYEFGMNTLKRFGWIPR